MVHEPPAKSRFRQVHPKLPKTPFCKHFGSAVGLLLRHNENVGISAGMVNGLVPI